MTTIVASVAIGGMAADTRVANSGSYYPARKIFRIGESIFGTAGHGDMCLAFIHWVQTPKRDPIRLHELIGKEYEREDITIMELNPDGIFMWSGWGFPEKVLRDSHAIGTGGMAALEALRCGKSLEDAVTSAMGHDEYTGCDVQSEYLLPSELSSKRKRRGK